MAGINGRGDVEEELCSSIPTESAAPRAAPIVPEEREKAVDEFRPSVACISFA